MLDLKLSLYSKSVLGGSQDRTTASKKTCLLTRLGICDQTTRSISITGLSSLIALFRVVHFTCADLQACRDFSIDDILLYRNPCNLRNALFAAIGTCAHARLTAQVEELESLLFLNFKGGLTRAAEEVRKTEKTIFSSASPILDNLEVVQGSSGYSLLSKSGFKRGDYVMTLTEDVAISILSAFRDPKFPAAALAEQGLHPDTIFLLYLIHLRDHQESLSNPIHRDFFSRQQANYGTLFELPIEVVQALDEPDLFEAVRLQNDQLRQICCSLQPQPAFEDLLWAKSLCTSRAFSLKLIPSSQIEEKLVNEYYPTRHITTIVPLVHLLNHDFSAQLETPFVCPGGCVALRALVDVDAGSELFLNYGGFSNKELLLNYGFFVKNNPYDTHEVGNTVFRRGAMIHCHETVMEPTITVQNVPEEYRVLVSGYLADRASFRSTCKNI